MTGLRKFSLKKYLLAFVVFTICFALTWRTEARNIAGRPFGSILTNQRDTVPTSVRDSTRRDSLAKADTGTRQKIDTFSVKLSKDTLDAPVNYEADDSAVVVVDHKKIILYGKTKTTYKDITLNAPKVDLDQQTNILTATADYDSAGIIANRAQFEQGEQNFQSDTIKFNFKTQKGLTQNTFTQQGEMFVHGEKIKKVDANTFFVSRGGFTTCNLDEPHFAFRTNRLKVINNKMAVSGPTHPEFENVPIPIYLPFGFFPLSHGRHSGFLPPQFTTNEQYGLGLEGIGYYKVLNDHYDVTLRGNIYSYGGWTANVTSSYRTRYRYNGAFNFALQHTKTNFKGDPDYGLSRTMNITWNHAVDQRARPGTSFSANVNAGSTKFNQFIPNNPNRNFQNRLASSIAYSKSWAGKPYNLTLSANHDQNAYDSSVRITLPDAGFTVQTIYPFQRKEMVGTPKWYEKLGIGYNGVFRNQLAFQETGDVTIKRLLDTLQWGAQHNLPITLSLPAMGPFLVSPSFSYREVWLQQKSRIRYNDTADRVDTALQKGLFTDREVSFGVGFNTALFGTFNFRNSRVMAIRHTVRPTFGMNYKPDLSKKHYYNTRINKQGDSLRVNEYVGSLFSGFGEGEFGGMSFGVDNNLEMKMRSKKDTGEAAIKKVRLIDGFGFNSAYNFLDSIKLQPFTLYLRSTLFEKLNLNVNALLDPRKLDKFGRPTKRYAWQDGTFNVGRVTSGSISMSTSFESKKKQDGTPNDDKTNDAGRIPLETDPTLMADQQQLLDYMRRNPAEFVDFNIPWSINFSYSLNYYSQLKPDLTGYESKVTSNLSFNNSFNLTPKWNFSTNGFFDFTTKEIQSFTMSISRDMHCWQMSINVTPVGPYRYFSLNINPKASMLQDLKVNRTRYFTTF